MPHHRPQTTQGTVPATQLPALYQRWKWRILVVYASFYLFQYVGRFHLSQVAALVMQDLAIDHHTLGWITALLYWGFMAGDLVHGRLGEIYGLRLWVLLGALLTTACNWLASLSGSAVTLAILWCINGFVNAACWSPGISLLAQWWPRRERGQALGVVGRAAGGAMLVMWLVSGWVGEQFAGVQRFGILPSLLPSLG
jgi:OPA family glycerol-3-phosphate transporter-like MFS transporter